MDFRVGQRVLWDDPEIDEYGPEDKEYAINRIFIVHAVDNRHGTAYIVEENGRSEAEVYTDELIPI